MLSPVAAAQLAAWEAIAERAVMTEVPVPLLRCDEPMLTGEPCGRSVAVLTDNFERRYGYTHAELLALRVLHLRNFHAWLDPDPA
jgi:hypothetical protein